jgi:F0F1-type ATP synthase membrane subunit b/b'
MTEKTGHFENGKWVEDPAPGTGKEERGRVESRVAEASRSVSSAIDDAIRIGRDLFETEEGRRYVEKTVRDAGAEMHQAIQDILSKAKEEIDRSVWKK